MVNDAFLSLLGIARKAGRLTFGFSDTAAAGKNVMLVIAACDLSEKTEKELRFRLNTVDVIRVKYSIAELTHATGKPAGVIGFIDEGFAAKAVKLIGEARNISAE